MDRAETLTVGDLVIEEVNYRSMSDDQVAAVNALENVLRAESFPDDPPRPVEETAAESRTLPDYFVIRQFWAFTPDGGLAGQGYGYWTTTEENRHLVRTGIEVHPDHRRRGLARVLLRLVTETAEGEGRTLLMGNTNARVPAGEAFAKRVGAEPGLTMHTNRLLLSEVDLDLVRSWIEEGPRRAPGYSLVWVESPYPDDMLEEVASVMNVMNTAPRDDLQMEDRNIKPEEVRQWERMMIAAGNERWSLFARHDESGRLVGYTEVFWNANQPKTVGQGDTGVLPEHRGHALGKWLKATMLDRILTERPGVEDVRTGNADSNAPMLAINRRLGFRPYLAQTAWQVPVERVRAYLDNS